MNGKPKAKDSERGFWVRLWRTALEHWFPAGLNLLLPPRCLLCQADLDPADSMQPMLCQPCRERLATKSWDGCARCGALLPPGTDSRCNLCHGMKLYFDSATALGPYEAELREIVYRMKRESGEPFAEAMAKLLIAYRHDCLSQWACTSVVPIPMFWTRRLVRRTNNPEVLAGHISRQLGVHVEPKILYRCRNTKLQRELLPRERFRNVAGAFAVRPGISLSGQNILLVDDVMTTGATANEAARVLKKAGAAKVLVAVIARAQGN